MANENGTARLDRMERMLEMLLAGHVRFDDEHKRLLTAQVVLTDRVDKNALAIAQLMEAQKATDERLNALIAVVDDWWGFRRRRIPIPGGTRTAFRAEGEQFSERSDAGPSIV